MVTAVYSCQFNIIQLPLACLLQDQILQVQEDFIVVLCVLDQLLPLLVLFWISLCSTVKSLASSQYGCRWSDLNFKAILLFYLRCNILNPSSPCLYSSNISIFRDVLPTNSPLSYHLYRERRVRLHFHELYVIKFSAPRTELLNCGCVYRRVSFKMAPLPQPSSTINVDRKSLQIGSFNNNSPSESISFVIYALILI